MGRKCLSIVLIVLLPLAHARAQNSSPSGVVRREVARPAWIGGLSGSLTGTLRDLRIDSLILDSTASVLRGTSAGAMAGLDVRQPLPQSERSHSGLVGLAIGAALGAGVGFLVAIPTVHHIEHEPNHDGPFQQIDYLLFPAVGAVVGGGLGYAIGHGRS